MHRMDKGGSIPFVVRRAGDLMPNDIAEGGWAAGSRVHLFDTGHFWPFEAPHETVDVIRAFLDSVTG
jgi:hypothetical protein